MAYFAREEVFADPQIMQRAIEILKGKVELDWMREEIERVRCRPSQPGRGLTYADTNVGCYGWEAVPEKIRHNLSMAPRGAVLPQGLPNLGYTINRKSEVWSENCADLYEESKSRHWAPARDVPWGELAGLDPSEDAERARAQLYTGLTSMAMALQDLAMRWVWRINQELLELKSLLCAQTFSGAELADAFRKRAIAGGAGLGEDQVELEELLKGVLDSPTYPCASAAGNLLLAGLLQSLIRHLGSVAHHPVDQAITRLAVQDASRLLSYGTGHLTALLRERPHEAPAIAGHLEEIEGLAVGFLGAPRTFSALALATGGSRDGAREAVGRVARFYGRFTEEHLRRGQAAGLGDRRDGSPLSRLAQELGGG